MFEQNITLGPGTGTFATHTFEIFLMLGVAFLLGLWLGWILWSRFKQQAEKMRLEFDSLNATVQALRTESETLKGKVIDLEAGTADLQSRLTLSIDETNFFREQNNDLEERLRNLAAENRRLLIELGLAAPTDLTPEAEMEIISPEPADETVAAPPEELAEVSDSTDLQLSDPILESAEGYYTDLIEETEYLSLAGMHEPEEPVVAEEEVTSMPVTEPAAEELEDILPHSHLEQAETENPQAEVIDPPQPEAPDELAPSYIFTGPHDDLKVVEGIGPKIEELLFKNGIQTYTDLARTPVSRLKEILIEAGPRYVMHDPGTWSAQALLAANGEWDNLKAYQEFLNAGKRPK